MAVPPAAGVANPSERRSGMLKGRSGVRFGGLRVEGYLSDTIFEIVFCDDLRYFLICPVYMMLPFLLSGQGVTPKAANDRLCSLSGNSLSSLDYYHTCTSFATLFVCLFHSTPRATVASVNYKYVPNLQAVGLLLDLPTYSTRLLIRSYGLHTVMETKRTFSYFLPSQVTADMLYCICIER